MGQLTRQGRPLQVRVKQAVHAESGDLVEIGGASGLQRGPVAQNRMASVAEAVEEKKNAAHAKPFV